MQQFYGLNLDDMGAAYTPAHAAALAAQLPRESRCFRAEAPACEWGDAEYLLASIEYSCRALAWAKTKDAQRGRNVPKPLQTPAERARVASRIEHTDFEFVKNALKGVVDG